MHNLSIVVLALIASLVIFCAPRAGIAEDINDAAHDVYLDLLSPFCPGRSLNDCPTEKASDLKEEIKKELVAGKNKEEIIDGIVAQYGSGIKADPDFRGTNMLAWGLPFLFILVGVGILKRTLVKKED